MNTNILKYAMLITKGTLVGFGAIMPGISGGTLCAAFGMYKPLLGLLSSPRKTIRDNGLDILAFLTGIGFGFVELSGLASWLMEKNSKILICVFIGLIIGTIPELWANAGENGRKSSSYISMASSFFLMLCILVFFKFTEGFTVEPNIRGFLLCGILWGISFIVPGMSSSTLIIFFGLYQPMLNGISKFSIQVLFPLVLGMGICLIALSKAVNLAYKKWYTQFSHAIIGVIMASTVMIVPYDMMYSTTDVLLGVFCAVAGFIFSFAAGKLCLRLSVRIK